jgi:hypothetical protein
MYENFVANGKIGNIQGFSQSIGVCDSKKKGYLL